MSLQGHSTVWAIGDCALVPNEHDGQLSPPTAQFAIREGHQLANNIARAVRGEEPRPFNYESKGSMATIGHLNGVAEMFGKIRLSGFPAWFLWRAFYLSLMPTVAKKREYSLNGAGACCFHQILSTYALLPPIRRICLERTGHRRMRIDLLCSQHLGSVRSRLCLQARS